jgi:hypothetical protein
MQSIKELEKKYNEPIAVLGAGPNLPDDMTQIPDNSILIGLNWHASELPELDLDFMCFCDSPKFKPELLPMVEAYEGKRLTYIKEYADILIDVPFYWGGLTFGLGVWAACFMTTGPVILAGMDCRQTGRYFYQEEGEPDPDWLPKHMSVFHRVFDECDSPARIRAASGPLVKVFGRWGLK